MGTISRVKSWNTNETLTASDLNAEFTNIINNINSNNLDNTNLDTSATYQFDSVIVGHSALVTTSAAYKLQGLGTGAVDSGMALGRFSADANGPTVSFLKSRHGTIGSNTIVQDNDILGTIEFMAADGSTLDTPGASIFARVNGTPGANDLPTELVFATTADGANSVTERMRISTAGLVSVVGDMSVGDDLLLASDSAVLSLGDGADATLTHDGTTGVTIAANPITVDSGGNLTLDAHTGILIIKDAGSEVLRFTEGNSGDVTVKLATNGKDLVFTDNGDATNMKILDAAAGINVPGEVQTTKIAYTDGDDAITIADGGGVTTSGTLTIGTVAAAGSDTDKFLVLDSSGNVDYRTGSQVLSDIGGAGSGSGTAADDISTGDAAVSIATTSGNITIDAQANNADVIIKVDNSAITALTLDGSDEGNAIFVNDVQLKSDGALLEFGADLDTTLTHTDGTGLTLNSTNKLTFGDAASFVQQSADGTLRIDGEAIIDLNASTRVDVSGDLKVGGEVQTASIGYTDGDNAITIADGGGVTTAGTLATTGAATLASMVCTAGATFGGGYGSTGATISTDGVGQFNGALTTDGVFTAASLDISGAVDIAGDLTLSAGADGALRFSVASSVKMLDNSATSLVFEEADNAYMTFVTTDSSEAIKFDKALDINAAMQIDNTVTVGVNGTGYDVQLFGDTPGSSVLWDQSADDLILTNAGLAVGSDATGDLYYRNSSGFLARLGVGSDGQVLTSTGTLPNWEAAASSGISWDGSTANGVATYKDGDEATVESNLTFTGSALTVTGTATVTSTITAGGVVDVTDGSASAPAICNTGDTNTGILFPAADTIGMTTAGTERVRIGSDGEVLVNETANGNQSAGAMTLNQDANDAGILALKSSDVAHGVTDYAETDTYGEFLKANAPTGGLIVRGYDENANGLQMWGIYADDSSNSNLSAKTASATAPVSVIVAKKSGTGLAQVPADENIFMIQSWGQSARFVVDEDGEIYSDGAHSTFDEFDDVQLLRAVDHSLDAPGLLMGKFDDMLEYNEASLIEAGLLGGPRKGQPESDRGLINYTGMVRLQSGAIWQLYTQQREMREVLENQVKELRDEILALREKN